MAILTKRTVYQSVLLGNLRVARDEPRMAIDKSPQITDGKLTFATVPKNIKPRTLTNQPRETPFPIRRSNLLTSPKAARTTSNGTPNS